MANELDNLAATQLVHRLKFQAIQELDDLVDIEINELEDVISSHPISQKQLGLLDCLVDCGLRSLQIPSHSAPDVKQLEKTI